MTNNLSVLFLVIINNNWIIKALTCLSLYLAILSLLPGIADVDLPEVRGKQRKKKIHRSTLCTFLSSYFFILILKKIKIKAGKSQNLGLS